MSISEGEEEEGVVLWMEYGLFWKLARQKGSKARQGKARQRKGLYTGYCNDTKHSIKKGRAQRIHIHMQFHHHVTLVLGI